MFFEDLGWVAPSPVRIQLTKNEMTRFIEEARKRNAHRKYDSRSDSWGHGFCNPTTIADIGSLTRRETPIFVGMLGEYALAKHLNSELKTQCIEIDLTLTDRGDGGVDLEPFGMPLQVKTRKPLNGSNLVRRVDDKGNTIPLCDNFVFCQTPPDNFVNLLGWCEKAAMEHATLVKSPVANHFNLVLEEKYLLSMEQLVSELEVRRETWNFNE